MSRATRLLLLGTLHFVREASGSFGESWKIMGKMIGIPPGRNTQGHALKNPIQQGIVRTKKLTLRATDDVNMDKS